MGFEDVVRSAAPGGNVSKPLMLAVLALLASGALFRGGTAEQPLSAWRATDAQPRRRRPARGSRRVIGQAATGRSGQCGKFLGRTRTKSARSGLSEEEVSKQLSEVLPGIVDKLTPEGRMPTEPELSQRL
jgi:YidB-like protein